MVFSRYYNCSVYEQYEQLNLLDYGALVIQKIYLYIIVLYQHSLKSIDRSRERERERERERDRDRQRERERGRRIENASAVIIT